jgi:hypothetical protein
VKSKFVDLEFVVPEVLVAIVQDYPIRRDIVLLKATGLKFTFVKRSFDMQVVAKLRSLLVEDKLQTYGTDFQYLATSTRSDSSIDNDLVVIEYTNIQRVSQDFCNFNSNQDAPHYANVDQSVKLSFNSLFVMWNPETIIPLYNMINYVFGSSSRSQNFPTSTSNSNLSAHLVNVKPSPMKKKQGASNILNLQVYWKTIRSNALSR